MLLREIIERNKKQIMIISKIEDIVALRNIEEIIEVSDGIMIARGDLGMNVNIETLYGIQKHITKLCNKHNKLVITATQMLEFMTENVFPTRAEVIDVSNAVQLGSDCVMLSGETANGKFPILALKMMDKICKQAELMRE